jgi:hypothetical protein
MTGVGLCAGENCRELLRPDLWFFWPIVEAHIRIASRAAGVRQLAGDNNLTADWE